MYNQPMPATHWCLSPAGLATPDNGSNRYGVYLNMTAPSAFFASGAPANPKPFWATKILGFIPQMYWPYLLVGIGAAVALGVYLYFRRYGNPFKMRRARPSY